MKSFKQFNEESKNVAVFTFGRFNPPTVGHEKLLIKVAAEAIGNSYKIFASQSNDPQKNPLEYKEKVKVMRKMFPKFARNIILDTGIKNVFDALTYLYNEGFTEVKMVVGSDRIDEFRKLIHKYNDVKGRHGYYSFNVIDVISAGERDPDSDDVSGMSASKMRAAAAEGDFKAFSSGLPRAYGEDMTLFNLVRKRMGLSEMVNFRKHIQLPQHSSIREAYIANEIFNVGDIVYSHSANKIIEISERGPNYIVDTNQKKHFIEKLSENLPKEYGADLSKSTKSKRAAQFNKQAKMDDDNPRAYKPAPGDARAETKPSKYTQEYEKRFAKDEAYEIGTDEYTRHVKKVTPGQLDEKEIAGLRKKAEESGISYDILKKVFDRGMAAWKSGHRPGATPHQWAFARVNSFIVGGKTRQTADADLWKARKESLAEGQILKSFSQFTEKFEEPINSSKLHIVVLGKENSDGTFAGIVEKVCKKKKLKYDFVDMEEAWISQNDIEVGNVTIQNYDGEDNSIEISTDNSIIFVRAGAIESLQCQSLIASLQTIGFFLVNDLQSMLLCDNKMSSALTLERNNIPTPKTAILNSEKSIEDAHKRVGGKFPVIIKTLTGTQGVGVSKVNDYASLISVAQSLWKYDAQLLIQEYLNVKSDVRTLVVGGRILGAAERIRDPKEKDFRNNVHLGAETKPYKLSEEEKQIIVSAAKASGALYCGVDHCVINGNPYILEINGSPGIRSHFNAYDPKTGEELGKKTDVEILEMVLDFFSTDLNRRPLMRQEAGYIETIILDGLENNPIRAKFDTGNSTIASMLHVDAIEENGNEVTWTKNGKTFKSKIVGVSKAKRGLKTFDIRPIVKHGITFNNKKYVIELGLSTKDTASEMLVCRDLMTKFNVAVNPNRKFILSQVTKRNDDTDH